jgi:hypothetical protein
MLHEQWFSPLLVAIRCAKYRKFKNSRIQFAEFLSLLFCLVRSKSSAQLCLMQNAAWTASAQRDLTHTVINF